MKAMLIVLGIAAICLCSTASGAVVGEAVEYQAQGVSMKGYLAYDDAIKEKRPGVIVVHEWWGLNEYARNRARMLAELGYTAFAIDMYGEGKTTVHPKEAGEFAAAVRNNMPAASARFNAAMDVIKKHRTVIPDKIAAIGYCFGGGILNYDNCSPTVSNCIFSNNSGCGMCNITLSSPIVIDCTFSNNTANSGSAMNNGDYSSPTIDRCRFYGNTAGWRGGAMTISDYSSPTLTNCVFSGNSTSGEGGGMYISNNSNPTLTHCTFSGNSATGFGGGVYTQDISNFAITNSILWNNTSSGPLDFSAQIFDFTGIVATINYSCILGWSPSVGGTGNITSDPNFVDSNGLDNILGTSDDDLSLSSGSPCIDAADSIVALSLPFDVSGNKRGKDDPLTLDTGVDFWGVTVDMGAYEFSTHCISPGNPDIDCNGIVDFKDFAYLADNWLSEM